jgi:hypothetical protein
MKAVIIIALAISLEIPAFSQNQTDLARPPYRGIAAYVEIGGASLGVTANAEVVFAKVFNWKASVRGGFGTFKRYEKRVTYLAVPIGMNIFKGHRRHHREIGLNASYVRGATFGGDIRVNYSEGLYLIPTFGYRYQGENGGLFFKVQYSPFVKLTEFTNDRAFKNSTGKIIHLIGLSLGYFFVR